MALNCVVCRFDVELDDAVVEHSDHKRCVCLRCYERETGTEKPMPNGLKREAEQTANDAPDSQQGGYYIP